MTKLAIIAAMTQAGVIGRDNKLPWHIREELKYFKQTTMGKPIIMGRKTFESIGSKPLPGRFNVVITRSLQLHTENLVSVSSIAAALALPQIQQASVAMLIGGRDVFTTGLQQADLLYLSIIKKDYPGDVFFPEYDKTQWEKLTSTEYAEFTAQVWQRIT